MKGLGIELSLDNRVSQAQEVTSDISYASYRRRLLKGAGYAAVGVVALRYLGYLASAIPKVFASDIVVGTGTTPDIDGEWGDKEWDDAIDYELPILKNVNDKGKAYTRFKHDDSNLYFIIDVVSNLQSDNYDGSYLIAFDPNNDGFSKSDPNDQGFVDHSLAFEVPKFGFKQVGKYGTSPHSDISHLIREYSVSMDWLTKIAPTNQNGQKVIGYDAIVLDAKNNWMGFLDMAPLSETQPLAQMTFQDIPTPESTGLVLPLGIAVAIFGLYSKRRYENSKSKRKRP